MSHLSFREESIAPWERPSVLSQWLSSHSSLLSNGAYPPSPACLANLSHRVSWQPSRGFPALVSTITFKCVVGGDAPLSVSSASNSEVCLGPREEPGSQSQSDPSGSVLHRPGLKRSLGPRSERSNSMDPDLSHGLKWSNGSISYIQKS